MEIISQSCALMNHFFNAIFNKTVDKDLSNRSGDDLKPSEAVSKNPAVFFDFFRCWFHAEAIAWKVFQN